MRLTSMKNSAFETYSLEDVASMVGCSKMAVSKKKGIDNYIVSKISSGGRPRIMLHPDVLSLFGIVLENDSNGKMVKKRIHKDKPLLVDLEIEQKFVDRALEIYLSQGNRKFVENACIKAAKEFWNDNEQYFSVKFKSYVEMAVYFYKRRITRRDRGFVGYAYRVPSWQIQWERRFKQNDIALKHIPTLRYSWIEVMEDAKIIGPGFGAGKIWFFDDHIGDSFMYDEDKKGYKGTLPKGLYMIDGVTGAMLDYEVGEVNSTLLVFMILKNVLRFGIPVVIGLENSKAMKNKQVDGVIQSLYPDSLLDFYKNDTPSWYNELFPRSSSPIVRNLPNIPRSPFKARLERIFQDIVRHDGWLFPKTFTGGGKDPVQFRNSNMPVQPRQEYTLENYKKSILHFLDNDFAEKIRPEMFSGFHSKTGKTPTIRNVWNFYGGDDNAGTQIKPDMSKFAACLYYLSKIDETGIIISRQSKASAGKVTCKVNDRQYLFVDAGISHYVNMKVDIVFIPDMLLGDMISSDVVNLPGEYAALFVNTKYEGLKFINICRDMYVRQVWQAQVNRKEIKEVRREMKLLETQNHKPLGDIEERILIEDKSKKIHLEEKIYDVIETVESYDDDIMKLINL